MMQPKTIPIALTLDDGSVAIMQYVTEGLFSLDAAAEMIARGQVDQASAVAYRDRLVLRKDTDDAIAVEISRGSLAARVVSWRRLTPEELPTDRRYRNSWRDDGARVGLAMAKAREERLTALKDERGPKLDQLDRDWNRATGQRKQVEADAIEAKREALRNAPQTLAGALSAAQTADDLDAIGLPE